MKRALAVLAVTGLILGSGVEAFAASGGGGSGGEGGRRTPEAKAQVKACLKQARTDHRGDRPAVREAVKACLAEAGITRAEPTPEQRERRHRARECRREVREAHPDAPREQLRDLVKECRTAD